MNELAAKLQARADSPELPLLRLLAWSRLPPLLFGVVCGLLVIAGLLLPLLVTPMDREVFRGVLSSALFFGASIGILTGFSRSVFSGAALDLSQLAPVLPPAKPLLETATRALSRITVRNSWFLLGFAVLSGTLHSWLIGYHFLPLAFAIPQCIGTLLLWTAMSFTVPPLVQNASLFSSLGQIAQPDLLRPSRHAAFGAAALRPALFLIGLLCAYTLLFIGNKNPFAGAVWIGILASVVPLFAIVAMPLRGIRRRIREQRQATLSALDTRLDAITSSNIAHASADDLFQLDAILDMRERVAKAPSWPFDVAAIKRILLYTILPPMTWAAAAIVEMMIDRAV